MSTWLNRLTAVLPALNLTYSPDSIMSVVKEKVGNISVADVPADLMASYQEATNGTDTNNDDAGFGFGVASIALVSAMGLTALVYVGYKACRYGLNKFREYQAGHAQMLTNVEHGGDLFDPETDSTTPSITDYHINERTPMPVVDVKLYGAEVTSLK